MKLSTLFVIFIVICFLPFTAAAQPEQETGPSAEGNSEKPKDEPHNDMMGNAGDASYEGTWECVVDKTMTVILVMKEGSGGSVAGKFAGKGGSGDDAVEGELRGEAYMSFGKKLLDGTWSNEAGESGWLRFDISDDGSEFYGSWGYGEEKIEGHSWNGEKVEG